MDKKPRYSCVGVDDVDIDNKYSVDYAIKSIEKLDSAITNFTLFKYGKLMNNDEILDILTQNNDHHKQIDIAFELIKKKYGKLVTEQDRHQFERKMMDIFDQISDFFKT